MGKTSIEWTDVSWPVVNGCRRVSPGCERCYAERLSATRLRHLPKYAGLATYAKGGPRWTGASRLWESDLEMPLRLRKPSRIFVADMGDLFYEAVPDEVIDRVWAVMLLSPHHTFQVLTKRAERARRYLTDSKLYERVMREANAWRAARPKLAQIGLSCPVTMPAPWIWLGVSVEDQRRADERIPHLLATPAAVRFLSCEPLLGHVDLTRVAISADCTEDVLGDGEWHGEPDAPPWIDWVIVGSESGMHPRPMAIEWAVSLREQCAAAKVAIFTKQIGTPEGREQGDVKGGDPRWWPETAGGWPREFPAVHR